MRRWLPNEKTMPSFPGPCPSHFQTFAPGGIARSSSFKRSSPSILSSPFNLSRPCQSMAFIDSLRLPIVTATAANAELYGLIWCNFRNESIEFAHTGHTVALEPHDYIIFFQTRFFRGTVFDDLCDTDAARFAHSVASHVFLIYVFGINTKETAAFNEK